MMHQRRWMVTDVATPEELAAQLAHGNWTLCTGFRCNGFVWINDSFTEDSIQEYGVVRECDGVQIESVTVDWCTPEKIAAYQRQYEAGVTGPWVMGNVPAWQMETAEAHARMYCELCG